VGPGNHSHGAYDGVVSGGRSYPRTFLNYAFEDGAFWCTSHTITVAPAFFVLAQTKTDIESVMTGYRFLSSKTVIAAV